MNERDDLLLDIVVMCQEISRYASTAPGNDELKEIRTKLLRVRNSMVSIRNRHPNFTGLERRRTKLLLEIAAFCGDISRQTARLDADELKKASGKLSPIRDAYDSKSVPYISYVFDFISTLDSKTVFDTSELYEYVRRRKGSTARKKNDPIRGCLVSPLTACTEDLKIISKVKGSCSKYKVR